MNADHGIVIQVRDLQKKYGDVTAVRGISFDVRQGEIFGVIGPDGAGKTSSLHVIAGIADPSGGSVDVLGQPSREARRRIGYLTQRFSLYPDLSVDENLRYAANMRLVSKETLAERGSRYLALMHLDDARDRITAALSGGMKQKLALCCALIAEPRVLVLDEPTAGVDPLSRREFWNILTHLVKTEGTTILLATPYLDEAERCDRVALMHQGRFLHLGTPEELRKNQANPSEPTTIENLFIHALSGDKESTPPPAFPRSAQTQRMRGETAIEIDHLIKRFHSFTAVDDVSFKVARGDIFGLLGANGAGKTTIIKMMCGLLEPDRGYVELSGKRGAALRSIEVRRRIGYMSQRFTLYDDLTVRENLAFYAGMYGISGDLRTERIAWAIDTCDLRGRDGLLTADLPGGWKQRLSFGAAVLHDPDILFLDEPTSGVDPVARRELWRLIDDFAANGAAVVVTTHHLEEAEHCARMCFMSAGRIVAQGSPNEIRALANTDTLEDAFITLVQAKNIA